MTAPVVDLVAFARARVELRALVVAHPELTQPTARERLAAALPELMESPMSKPLDPNHAGTATTVGVRLTPDLLAAVDTEATRLRASAPWSSPGRSDAVRSLLLRALSIAPSTPVEATPAPATTSPASSPAHAVLAPVEPPATPAPNATPPQAVGAPAEPAAPQANTTATPNAATVRKVLIALRKDDPKTWSYRAIAERAGVSTAPVQKIINGENVTAEMLAKVAAILSPR